MALARAARSWPDRAFSWLDEGKLTKWIKQKNDDPAMAEKFAVIGHSYGGDTAASRVADGSKVPLLITIDPVSRKPPDMADVRTIRIAANVCRGFLINARTA